MIPTLTTSRLLLRPYRDEDLDAYAEFAADPEVMRYMGPTLDRDDAWRQMAMLLGHWHLRGFGSWAVEERATGELVGRLGPHQPEGWPGFEIGWVLGRRYWGRGYATEGAKAALEYAFTVLDQPHVISLIHPDNRASIRVAERLGEQPEGKTRVKGIDVLVYGIHRPD